MSPGKFETGYGAYMHGSYYNFLDRTVLLTSGDGERKQVRERTPHYKSQIPWRRHPRERSS